MNLKEIRQTAKDKLKGLCHMCPICDGRACAGQLPGFGGVGTGSAFTNNVKALEKWHLNLRALHDVVEPSTATSVFGHPISTPILAAPMAGAQPNLRGVLTDYELTKAIVQGCRQAGTIGIAGGVGSYAFQVLEEEDGQGMCILKPREQEVVIEWGQSAAAAGALGFGIDVDGAGLISVRQSGMLVEPKSVKKLRELTQAIDLPFIIKGIMTPDDAELAVEAGAKAIVVSNHGGRVLDHTPGAADVLFDIAKRVKGKIVIMVDGGIRSGSDILKILALGGDLALIGRPLLQAAVGGGTEGVQLAVQQLTKELEVAMILTGTASVQDVSPRILWEMDQ